MPIFGSLTPKKQKAPLIHKGRTGAAAHSGSV